MREKGRKINEDKTNPCVNKAIKNTQFPSGAMHSVFSESDTYFNTSIYVKRGDEKFIINLNSNAFRNVHAS